MVAAVEVVKGRALSGPESYFCRLIACDGFRPSRAYALAWKVPAKRANDLAARVLSRPHVAEKLKELYAQADIDGCLRRDERRSLLAETARNVPRGTKPKHSDRIAAILADARLTGDLDAEVVNAGTTINIAVVLQSLRGGVNTVLTEAQPVIDLVDTGTAVDDRTGGLITCPAVPVPVAVAPTQTILGPLGRVRAVAHAQPSTPQFLADE